MRCHVTNCQSDAVTEFRIRYVYEGGTLSAGVWEPLCGPHAVLASRGWLPSLSLVRPVKWVAQRPLEDHEHDYRIRSFAPVRIAGAVTGYDDTEVCPCGDRRLAASQTSTERSS
jgi:hypothetical protein